MADLADLERRLESARRQQRAISRVLGAVARSEGLQAVLDEVVEAVTLLSGVENGRLWLVEDGQLHAFANRGFEETFEYDRLNPHAIDETTMAGRTALARGLVHTSAQRALTLPLAAGRRAHHLGGRKAAAQRTPRLHLRRSSATFAASPPS